MPAVRTGAADVPRRLTHGEELRLARRIERGDLEAKRRLVEANVRLVASVACQYAGRGVPLEDLVQEGCIGLVRAAERFDHRRRLRFSTYATWWIRQAVVQALGQGRLIRIPESADRRLRALRRASMELTTLNRHEPSVAEAAEHAGLSQVDAARLATMTQVRSLDEPLRDDRQASREERVADPAGVAASGDEEPIDSARLSRLVAALPARQRIVVELTFGLGGRVAVPLRDVAVELGVSDERARQLRAGALQRLRLGLAEPRITAGRAA